MKLYDLAAQIFVKRVQHYYVTDATIKGLTSDIEGSIAVAKLFLSKVEEDKAAKPLKIPVGAIVFPPEDTL